MEGMWGLSVLPVWLPVNSPLLTSFDVRHVQNTAKGGGQARAGQAEGPNHTVGLGVGAPPR